MNVEARSASARAFSENTQTLIAPQKISGRERVRSMRSRPQTYINFKNDLNKTLTNDIMATSLN